MSVKETEFYKRNYNSFCPKYNQGPITSVSTPIDEILVKEDYDFVLNREYTTTDRYPLTVSRLKKIIKRPNSPFNELRKTDVVKDIIKHIIEGNNGYWDYVSGENSQYVIYRLVILNGKIKIVINNERQVVEFY